MQGRTADDAGTSQGGRSDFRALAQLSRRAAFGLSLLLAFSLREAVDHRGLSAWPWKMHFAVLALACCLYTLWIGCVSAVNAWRAWRAYGAWALRHPDGRAVSAADAAAAAVVARSSGAAAVLVLGGEPWRDELGAKLAMGLQGEDSFVFMSSGHYKMVSDFDAADPNNPHRDRFAGVNFGTLCRRMVYDREAIDTLANFTTFLEEVRSRGGCRSNATGLPAIDVLVVTSSYHLKRARRIAAVLLGCRGLSFSFVLAEPAGALAEAQGILLEKRTASETELRAIRDVLRAALWLLTGFVGDGIAGRVHMQRRDFRARYVAARQN